MRIFSFSLFVIFILLTITLCRGEEPSAPIVSTLKHHYHVEIKEVYDGDTVTADIHLGFRFVLMNQRLRLFGINTPEVRGPEKPEGLVTRDHLRKMILGKWCVMDSHKDTKGKYGRWLATLYFYDEEASQWININKYLIKNNLGKPATY